jgi:hypothetical protein
MRLPGFTALLALGNSHRRHYRAATRALAGTVSIALPANIPSGGKGGIGWGGPPWGWCPAQPGVPAPPGACPADGTVFDCGYAKARCDCYGETDPSGCCDYYDGHCLNVGPSGYPGDGGGGPVGGPPHHGPVLF